MICRSCGKAYDDAKFCPYCGAPSRDVTPTESTPTPNAFDAGSSAVLATPELPGYLGAQYSGQEEAEPFTGCDYLVGNAILLVLCCGFPTSIAGLVFSILARASKSGRDWQKAASQATIAQVFFWISLASAVLSYAVCTCALLSENATVDESIQKAIDARLKKYELSVGDAESDTFDPDTMLDKRQADELRLEAIRIFEATVDAKLHEFGFDIEALDAEAIDSDLDPDELKKAIDELPDDLLDDLEETAPAAE